MKTTGQFARSDIRHIKEKNYAVAVVCFLMYMSISMLEHARSMLEHAVDMGTTDSASAVYLVFAASFLMFLSIFLASRVILGHPIVGDLGGRRGMAKIIIKQAAKLLKNATVRKGKYLVVVEEAPHVGSRKLSCNLHGMASSYEMEVFDFVERETDGAPSSPLLGLSGICSSSSLLGISGVRGVGKTTLLRFVRDSYAHSGSSFSYVFFVGAGNGCTVGRLQHILSTNIGRPLKESDDDVHAAKVIISGYFRRKTFLLLLDDVRDRLDLEAVGLPMPLGHRQKVIFTTRNQAICGEMGCTISIQMKCLGEDDAWSLFKERVGDEINDAHPHIHNLAKKMSAECRGLPSALCALGRAMSTKRDVKEWRYAYETLKRKMKQRPPVDEIQEVDEDGEAYSDLHALVDELQDSGFF